MSARSCYPDKRQVHPNRALTDWAGRPIGVLYRNTHPRRLRLLRWRRMELMERGRRIWANARHLTIVDRPSYQKRRALALQP